MGPLLVVLPSAPTRLPAQGEGDMANDTQTVDSTTDDTVGVLRPAEPDETRRLARTVYRAMPETEPEAWA